MSLVTVNIEPAFLKELLAVARRIADALERAYPPILEHVSLKPAGPENLTTFDPEKEWELENEEERLKNLGQI
jgi:hypothetical protein